MKPRKSFGDRLLEEAEQLQKKYEAERERINLALKIVENLKEVGEWWQEEEEE